MALGPPKPSQDSTRPSRRVTPGREGIPHTGADPLPNFLAGITNEPEWMKNKRTLAYFRSTFKLGDLPNVIRHWYELEELLGFQETVSVLE